MRGDIEITGEAGMEGAPPSGDVSKLARGCSILTRGATESDSCEWEQMPAGERACESREERVGASIPVRWGSRVGWERTVTTARVDPVRVRPDGTNIFTVSILFME